METRFEKIDSNNINKDIIKEAGDIIKAGGLVAFPTETVYGLGGDALNAKSSEKIYAAKGRPSDNPLIVHIDNIDSLKEICDDIPDEAYRLADAFWPGPLTMIVKKNDRVPTETTGGLSTVAIRMPDDEIALAFIKAAGGFIAAPSANTSGRPSPTLAEHVRDDLDGKIEMILDGGQVGIGVESTIVDLTEGTPTILRPGYVTQEMLSKVLGYVDTDRTILEGTFAAKPKAPGMKYRHYAPKASMSLIEGDIEKIASVMNAKYSEAKSKGLKVGIMCSSQVFDKVSGDVKKDLGNREDEREIAHNLYKVLREFDEEDVDIIYGECFSKEGFGQAVMNRLLKAAGFTVINE
ncbi:MAG: threonylcarbamoyl-AMP synthase [Lachnospiraceae bacterium]|nr:threonylcarbamoyl-AMP synthase [Lachnospiraceae bacterium]